MNTECEVGPDDTPICKCLPDYIGDPLRECKRECESSFECSASEECQNFKCVTIFFGNIVGFDSLAADCNPDEVA